MKSGRQISKVFLMNGVSATIIIPIEIARRQGLDQPSHVIVEETHNGILVKKLEV